MGLSSCSLALTLPLLLTPALAASVPASVPPVGVVVCAALIVVLGPSKVFVPGGQGYNASGQSYFSAFENELRPACIVVPSSPTDVAQTLHIVRPFPGARMAIRAGGHQSGAGTANIDGGITVDLRGIQGITISADKTVARVAVGHTWADVYTALDAVGLGVAGGRAAKVGVAGLTLSGGLSYFSNRLGFVTDSVVNFEVVLADGRIVSANKSTNRDLWLALRGGVNNFGVVVRFDLAVFPQGPMWGGQLYYDISTLPQHFDALANYATTADPNSHFIMSMGYATGFVAVLNLFYSAKPAPNPSLAPFTSIPSLPGLGGVRVDSLKNFAIEQSALSVNGLRQNHMTTTFRLNRAFMQTAYDLFQASLDSISDVQGLSYAIGYQPFTQSTLNSSAKQGGNSLGLDPANGPLIMVAMFAQWDLKADDQRVLGAERALVQAIDAAARKAGVYERYRFTNYCFTGQDPISGYGPVSKAKLQATSKVYDRNGFFQNNVQGGFKLFV